MKGWDGFFDRPANTGKIKRVFHLVLLLLFSMDFIVHRHTYFSWEGIPGFFVYYGFLSCAAIVAVSKLLGRFWLQKGEGYYDE